MRKLKQALALLLALAMLLSMAAISEETLAPEQTEEPEQTDVLTEEAAEPAAEESVEEEAVEEPEEEPAEEPVEGEPTEEPAEGPIIDEPANENAMPGAPEICIAPEWEYEAEIGAITIPCTELPETLTFEWNFDGTAAQYAVQTAPIPEGDNPEERGERVYTTAPRIELPAANYAEGGWFSLYVTALLEDGTEIEGWKYFRLEEREVEEDGFALEVLNAKCDHDWGWDDETEEGTGICDLCGAECSHKKKYKEDAAVQRTDISPIPKGAEGCIIYFDIYQYTICKTCHKVVQRKLLRKKTGAVGMHDFSIDEDSDVEGNVCRKCGYDRTQCPHKNRYIYCDVEDEDEAIYQSVDDEAHLVSGKMWVTEFCWDCGYSFRDEEYGYFENVREEHSYSKGKCEYCKHKIKCSHHEFEYESYGFGDITTDYLRGGVGSYCYNANAAGYHYCRMYNAYKYCTICGYSKKVGSTPIKQRGHPKSCVNLQGSVE